MGYLIPFVIVVFVILWAISIYFVKTGKLSALDWSVNSLGLPQGSVRALLALLIMLLLTYSIFTGTTLPDLSGWLVGILGAVIGFYFGAAKARTTSPQPKAEESATPTS